MSYPVLRTPLPIVLPSGYRVDLAFQEACSRVWESAAAKVTALVNEHPDTFPIYTVNGKWSIDGEQWTHWCDGFLGGQLWMLSHHSPKQEWFRDRAEHYSRLIESRKSDDTVHDLGFIFWSTYRRWFEETGELGLRDVLVEAGRTAASRFQENGRYLPSFRAHFSIFIDIMMNIQLPFYAAAVTGDAQVARVAYEHALTTRRYLIRGDGSAAHEGIFDSETGRFRAQTTQQGFTDDGSWARGQAWALYGFGTAYRFTGDNRFLSTAIATANFYIDSTGDALIPPNDWAEPSPARAYESSAAAAAAGGLWQLAGLVQDEQLAVRYADYAVRALIKLAGPDFLSSPAEPWEGILKHGSYHERLGLGVDESVMFGDYWFLDAVDQIEAYATEQE